jgi:type IV pilus biogenesis protein CpaD/CtpE
MTLRSLLPALVVTSSIALAACGSDEQSAGPAKERTTRAQAVTEIGRVRASLDEAVAAVKAGDAKRADEILADGYVEHFEHVEGPLEEVDRELNAELEATLSHGIRDKVKAGASAAEVRRLVDEAKANLNLAEDKLR